MKLIVGLGNPGKEYENTRHNVGFIILNSILKNEKWLKKDNYEYIEKNYNNEKVIFVKPLTFMNLSGLAVQKIVHFYKIQTEDILIIHDDLDIKSKTVKFKFNSSSGGHNGIKSIIFSLNSQNFGQLKIGIGSTNNNIKDFVLGKLSKEELNFLQSDVFGEMINYYIENGIEKTMNKYNCKGD